LLGVFAPLISIPLLGELNLLAYWQLAGFPFVGYVGLGLSLLSLVLAFTKQCAWLWATALPLMGLVALTYKSLPHDRSGILGALIQIQGGWGLLPLGILLLLGAAATSTTFRVRGLRRIQVLRMLVVLVAILGVLLAISKFGGPGSPQAGPEQAGQQQALEAWRNGLRDPGTVGWRVGPQSVNIGADTASAQYNGGSYNVRIEFKDIKVNPAGTTDISPADKANGIQSTGAYLVTYVARKRLGSDNDWTPWRDKTDTVRCTLRNGAWSCKAEVNGDFIFGTTHF
jgi:hypothetical protein